jgi:hypothetical protein
VKYVLYRRIFIAFVCVFALAVICYLLIALPICQERTDLLRAENKVLEKDISEIKDIHESPDEIALRWDAVRAEIKRLSGNMQTGAADAKVNLAKVCTGAGIPSPAITVKSEEEIRPAGERTPALYAVDAVLRFASDREAGLAVMKDLEGSKAARYEILSFGYVEDAEDAAQGAWLLNVRLYYYR